MTLSFKLYFFKLNFVLPFDVMIGFNISPDALIINVIITRYFSLLLTLILALSVPLMCIVVLNINIIICHFVTIKKVFRTY